MHLILFNLPIMFMLVNLIIKILAIRIYQVVMQLKLTSR